VRKRKGVVRVEMKVVQPTTSYKTNFGSTKLDLIHTYPNKTLNRMNDKRGRKDGDESFATHN